MRVNAVQCNGCGACVEKCPSAAISLNAGIVVIDQATCTQCQACVDACPVGAITAIELPVVAAEPVVVKPVRKPEIVVVQPGPSSPRPWLRAALAFAGQEILPRLADALVAVLDRRLEQAQVVKPQTSLSSRDAELSPVRKIRRGYRQRSRSGQGRRHGRGQDRGVGKANWS